jgi:hypothetical protein
LASVVIRVDEHRGEVPGHGGVVRRFEHLARVRGVEERVVVPQPPGQLAKRVGEPLVADQHRRVGLVRPEPVLPLLDRRDGIAQPVLQVHRATVLPALLRDERMPVSPPHRPASSNYLLSK